MTFASAARLAIRIKNLQKKNSLVNSVDKNGNTALHWACLNGYDDCAETLLSFGVNINARYVK